MTTTTNLQIDLVPSSTAQPEIVVNEALADLDKAIAGGESVNFAADSDLTLSDVQALNAVLMLTDTQPVLTASRNVIVPSRQKVYLFRNSTAQILTVKTSAGTGVRVNPGAAALVACDGVDVEQFIRAPGPYIYAATYAASISVDVAGYDMVDVTLTGHTTIDLTGGEDGSVVTVRVKQDSTGGWSVTWGTSIRFGADMATANVTTDANSLTYVGFRFNAAASKWDAVAKVGGFV